MGAMQDFITSVLNNPHIQALEHATGQITKPIQQAGQDVISGAMETPEQTKARLNTSGFHMGMKDVGNEIANNPASEALGAGVHLVSQLPHLAQAAHGLPAIGAIGSLASIGSRTKAEIQAAKDAGEAPKIHGGELPPVLSGILDQHGNPISSQRSPKYGYDNTKTSPYNPKAQGASAHPSTPQSKPFPNVPDSPTIVTDRTGKHPVTGGNPVWLDFSDQAKKNPYYLEDQAKSQNVLDHFVSGNTPLEVQKNLPLQLKEESQRIKNAIAENPSGITPENPLPITKQSIIDANTIAMQKAGINIGNNKKYDDTTKALLKILDTQLNAGKNNIATPENINGNILQEYIKNLDPHLQSAYKKIDNGSTLSDAESASLTMRRTVSNMLKNRYPSVSDALDRQHAMIDASPYVAKSASQEMKDQAAIAEKLANQPKLGIFDQIKAHPLGSAALALTGIEGVRGGKDVINAAGAGTQLASSTLSNMNKKPAMAQTPQAEPASNSQPRYTIQTPMDDGTLISEQEHGQQQKQLQEKIGQERLYDPNQANADQGIYQGNQDTYNAQANIRKASLENQQLVKSANNAYSSLQKAPINIMNVINKGYDAMAKANNGQYAKFAAELKYLYNLTGVDLSTAKSKEALQGAIDGIVEDQQAKLQAARSNFQGGAVQQKRMMQNNIPSPQPTNSAPVNWQQNAPETNAILSQ